jgi:alginate O-acetyltransferase complex protein AlgJ
MMKEQKIFVQKRTKLFLLALLILSALVFGADKSAELGNLKDTPYGRQVATIFREEVNAFHPRITPVSVRHIHSFSLANLDFAAWYANPILQTYDSVGYKRPGAESWKSADIGGLPGLDNPQDVWPTEIEEVEGIQPLAWGGIKNRLWQAWPEHPLLKQMHSITSWRWLDSAVYSDYQRVSALWYDASQKKIWVRIEFKEWADFASVDDEDGDGLKEYYGQVSLAKWTVEEVKQWEGFLATYTREGMNYEEVKNWAQLLASYWYPTLNTDLIPTPVFPSGNEEVDIIDALQGAKYKEPLMVMFGAPLACPLYLVFTGNLKKEQSVVNEKQGSPTKYADRSLPQNYADNFTRWAQEIEVRGSLEEWIEAESIWQKKNESFLVSLPAEQKALQGRLATPPFIFFRNSLDMHWQNSLSEQEGNKNPTPHLLELKYWAEEQETNVLFVPIPPKSMVYPDALPYGNDSLRGQISGVGYRQYLQHLQEEGFEVVDLLPHFLAARDSLGDVFQLDDTHWNLAGLELAAGVLAERIKAYSWYAEAQEYATQEGEGVYNSYSLRDTACPYSGDLVERLPAEAQAAYAPQAQQSRQVLRNGRLYKGQKTDPILLIGDSFTGVYEAIGCRNGGVGAHLAAKTGLGVDIITSWGGGPLVRRRAYKARHKYMPYKRVLIYMMAARDLWQYQQGWTKVEYK